MSSALELVPAISPPLVKTLRQYAVPSTYGDYEMTPGLNCLIVDAISYVRFLTDTSVTVNDYLQIEPFVPFLINVTSAAPVLEILRDSGGASPNLSFYPVAGSAPQVPWVPMQGPEYVVPYSVGTTATTYDLGVTGIVEVLVASAVQVGVVFGDVGDDMTAPTLFPVYPSSPMRFKLGPTSRRMALAAASGTANITLAHIGRAS